MVVECDTPQAGRAPGGQPAGLHKTQPAGFGATPEGLPRRRPAGIYRRFGKRALDLVLVLLAAPAILVLMVPLVIAVACDGGAPFYTQMRVGRGGRLYRMWKLRSMVREADRLLSEHLAADPGARVEWQRNQKLSHDPRITAVGRVIRKTSLDELPQLWNVLCGDMSLVGPRPMMDSQRGLYPGRAYYGLRPGITGLWQVAARNQTGFAARASFDTLYDRRLSLRQDLALLAGTVVVVYRCTGR
ncbi:sugar transferase [Salipiger aestuarii]|uniref:sugar transferase n=1 Tax=Salipiger aestuarii TaxID=568098 RepID=UPI001239A3F4|nr:sugar transferase [Salipiger aestuarii]